jgi:hypothetical protein
MVSPHVTVSFLSKGTTNWDQPLGIPRIHFFTHVSICLPIMSFKTTAPEGKGLSVSSTDRAKELDGVNPDKNTAKQITDIVFNKTFRFFIAFLPC